MAYLASDQPSPSHVSIVVTYRTARRDVPVFVVSSANGWIPEEMSAGQEVEEGHVEFTKTFKVPRSADCVTYKFRVGDGGWVWNDKLPTEYDGFGGMNNRFDIPSKLPDRLQDSREFSSQSLFLFPDDQTALPSPAATPRDVENDSASELEAPSISDWGDHVSAYDGCSEFDYAASPTHSATTGPPPYSSMSEQTDWIMI